MKLTAIFLALMYWAVLANVNDTAEPTNDVDINAKIAKLNIKTAKPNHIIRIFGKPKEYLWGQQTFTKDNLPPIYIMRYPDGFSVVMNRGRVSELRHTQPGYLFQGKLQVGDSLDKVLEVIGKPKKTVQGQPKPKLFQDGFLYKDIDGKKGYCHYGRKRKGARFFFNDYKVSALYVTRSDFSSRRRSQTTKPSSATDSKPAGIDTLAKDFIQSLAEADFSTAAEHFDAAMKKAAPPQKLRQIWDSLITQHGRFEKQTDTHVKNIARYKAVFVTCQFEKALVDLQVTFNSSEQIAGFFIVQTRSRTTYQPPEYAKSDSFIEKEVKVGLGQTALPGTLTLPKGQGPFPAAVLVHGSGPHNRDESIGPNKPFRDLAHGLAGKGIAVLRYEKRTKTFPLQMAAIADTLTIKEETIDDALAAVSLLRKTDKIDPNRIFVLGHSLGGFAIPRIGKLDPKISGFIVMAGSARPAEDSILEQFTYILSLDGTLTDQEKQKLDKLTKQVANVKDPNLSAATPASELPLAIPAAYWLDLRDYSGPQTAKELTQPMLILQGGRDYQVTQADFSLWKRALSSRKNVKFKFYEKLNHLFIEGRGKSIPAEYETPGHIARIVIEDITGWIKNP